MSDHAGGSPGSPCVFVVGCPRSGTTLLQRMLDAHPTLAIANDSHFIPRCLEKHAPLAVKAAEGGQSIPLTKQLAAGVREYHRFRRLGLDEEETLHAERASKTYEEYVSALYAAFARKNGKQVGGEKTPDYVRKLPLLHGLFPSVRSIHIVRDGRDTALSLLNWATDRKGPGKFELWKEQPVAVSALWWRWQVEAGRSAGSVLGPDRYHEVAYEDLVENPERHLRSIAAFLEIPFAEEMLQYHRGKVKANPQLSAKSAWLPPTAGLRNWREDMADADVELFEALAGDLLEAIGRERAFPRISGDVQRVAEECRDWWNAWLERRAAKARKRLERSSNRRP